ncbi:lamin tail domain-containing protein [Parasegetibacter sp. NRK P23]|uniref:lamin tail domain-containing protein n=1 Tax=Parasegetibacter sp. NRK P23 TaxID=2942999 RepID=UPI0020445D05|nr:lamin tail domain-containing protein [Parasegetibacter sp. NRK P23]
MNWGRRIITMILLILTGIKSESQQVSRYDVVITELMADPDPPVQLPAAEYVEVLNRSGNPVFLEGWTLSDRTGSGSIQGNFRLDPGAFLLLCATSNVAQFQVFGQTIGVTRFPSLDNAGDVLQLKDASGATIHAISYAISWYRESFKQQGGWSLEMIDTAQPCLDVHTQTDFSRNWSASADPEGGSPGKAGRIMKPLPIVAIVPVHSFMTDLNTIVVQMNMSFDTKSIARDLFVEKISGLNPDTVFKEQFWNDAISLHFSDAFREKQLYSIAIQNMRGCNGAVQHAPVVLPTAMPIVPGKEEVLLNELLFNPHPPAEDYIELHNKGPGAIDLSGMYLGGMNTAGAITLSGPLSPETRLLFPGEYIVYSAETRFLKEQYLVKDSARLFPLKTMPSYPDDKGTVLLFNSRGAIVDEVSYQERWHHQLLTNKEGVPLERIFTGRDSNDPNNWHSSAGTPGYKNAQQVENEAMAARQFFSLPYSLVSPNADGHQDILLLEYNFAEPGWIITVQVFDLSGRAVKTIARQLLAGTSGLLKWDGVAENGKMAPAGHYLLLVQYFHANGRVRHWKRAISIYGR